MLCRYGVRSQPSQRARQRWPNAPYAPPRGVRKRREWFLPCPQLRQCADPVRMIRSPSESTMPGITLIFPITTAIGLKDVGHAQCGEIFSLLVSKLGRHLQSQRRAMASVERLAVHLIAKQ